MSRFAKFVTVASALAAAVVPWRVSARTSATTAEAAAKRPGHATIPDSDGAVMAVLGDEEGVVTASVTLDPARKVPDAPRTYDSHVYRYQVLA